MGYTQVSSSLFTPISTGLNQQSNYGNNGLSSLGSSMHGSIGSMESFGKSTDGLKVSTFFFLQNTAILFIFVCINSSGFPEMGHNTFGR